MRLWIGLLLGFALGVGISAVFWRNGEAPPPAAPDPIPRTSAPVLAPHLLPTKTVPVESRSERTSKPAAPQRTSGGSGRRGQAETTVRRMLAAGPDDRKLRRRAEQMARYIGTGMYRNWKVSPDLVSQLLESGRSELRCLGVRFALRLETVPVAYLLRLGREDPSSDVRAGVARYLTRRSGKRSDVRGFAMNIAADANEVWTVRAGAIDGLGRIAAEHPEAARAVVSATRDQDAEVRREAIRNLPETGGFGTDRAYELMFGAEFDPEVAEAVAEAVVAGGRLGHALDQGVRAEYVPLLLRFVREGDTVALRGRFDRLLPLFQPEKDSEYEGFFGLAAELGEARFLSGVVRSEKERWAARTAALEAGLKQEKTRADVFAAGLAVLANAASPFRLRVRFIEEIASGIEDDDPLRPAMKAALERAANHDPNAWVRGAAKGSLGCLEEED